MNEAMHWLFTDEATAHGGLGEYEMRKKGLVPTGLDKRVCFVNPHMYQRCYMYNIPIALACACELLLLLISVVLSFVKIRNDIRAQTQQTFVCS
jgi:hypothetical protein